MDAVLHPASQSEVDMPHNQPIRALERWNTAPTQLSICTASSNIILSSFLEHSLVFSAVLLSQVIPQLGVDGIPLNLIFEVVHTKFCLAQLTYQEKLKC